METAEVVAEFARIWLVATSKAKSWRIRLPWVAVCTVLLGSSAWGQIHCPPGYRYNSYDCPPDQRVAPSAPRLDATRPSTDMAQPAQPAERPEAAAPDPSTLASDTGAAAAPASVAPNMVGDAPQYVNDILFGGGSGTNMLPPSRVFKMAENTSPLPTDRVFFNFNQQANAIANNALPGRVDLQSYVFGAEKTLWCGAASIEVRIPFTTGYDSTQPGGAASPAVEGAEFGNIGLAFKTLLWSDSCRSVSAGLTMTLPTADDPEVALAPFFTRIHNDVVHLAPFVGGLRTSDRWFTQWYVQADFPTSDYTVTATAPPASTESLDDFRWLFVDWSVGYWLYRDECGCGLTGVAPIFELHYNQTIGGGDTSNPAVLNFVNTDFSILNLTGALHFELGGCSNLRVSAVVPVTQDRYYDAEVAVQFNRHF